MYLHFSLQKAKALRVSDAGSEGEFYWTWQAYIQGKGETQLAQGFSTKCDIGSGLSFGPGEAINNLNDPRFTIALPDLNDGEERNVVIDLHCWESDHSSEEVKSVFTNTAV